jgi:hypothetical protein
MCGRGAGRDGARKRWRDAENGRCAEDRIRNVCGAQRLRDGGGNRAALAAPRRCRCGNPARGHRQHVGRCRREAAKEGDGICRGCGALGTGAKQRTKGSAAFDVDDGRGSHQRASAKAQNPATEWAATLAAHGEAKGLLGHPRASGPENPQHAEQEAQEEHDPMLAEPPHDALQGLGVSAEREVAESRHQFSIAARS